MPQELNERKTPSHSRRLAGVIDACAVGMFWCVHSSMTFARVTPGRMVPASGGVQTVPLRIQKRLLLDASATSLFVLSSKASFAPRASASERASTWESLLQVFD